MVSLNIIIYTYTTFLDFFSIAYSDNLLYVQHKQVGVSTNNQVASRRRKQESGCAILPLRLRFRCWLRFGLKYGRQRRV